MSKGERIVLASFAVVLFGLLIAKWVDTRAQFAELREEIRALRAVSREDPSNLCATDQPIGAQDTLPSVPDDA